MPLMPKGRYKLMDAYMQRSAPWAGQMMRRTCTVQVNLDFASEADMVQKFRVALALQPVATALFANSPFFEGKPNGWQSNLARPHLARPRSPTAPACCPSSSRTAWGSSAMSTTRSMCRCISSTATASLCRRAGHVLPRLPANGELPALPGEKPTLSDWADHLTTLFPEARIKKLHGDARRRWRPVAQALRAACLLDRADV